MIRIFRHAEDEGPGYLLDVIKRSGIPYQLVAVDRGQSVPRVMDDVCALVSLGGPQDVHDDLGWIKDEVAALRSAALAGLPVLGHNLGAELITAALGGMVVRSKVQRIGWFPVTGLDNEAARDWLGGLPGSFEVFHWHEYAFSLPAGASPLLTSPWCLQEGYVRERVLAFQGHLEVTGDMVRHRIASRAGRDLRPLQGTSPPDNLTLNWGAVVHSGEKICENLDRRIADLHRVADAVYGRWLELVKDAQRSTS